MFSWNLVYLFSFRVPVPALCRDCMVLQRNSALKSEQTYCEYFYWAVVTVRIQTHTHLFILFLYKRLVLAVLSLGVLTAWYFQMGAGNGVKG